MVFPQSDYGLAAECMKVRYVDFSKHKDHTYKLAEASSKAIGLADGKQLFQSYTEQELNSFQNSVDCHSNGKESLELSKK